MRDANRSRSRLPRALALGVAFALTAAACDDLADGPDGFSDEEWTHIRELTPFAGGLPANPHNRRADDPALAHLGYRLFYETRMTEPLKYDGPAGKMGDLVPTSCFTCHDSKYMVSAERIPIWQGAAAVRHTHDIPVITNMGWFDTYLWFGLFDTLIMHNSFGTGEQASPLGFAKFIATEPSYRDEYNELFDPDIDPRFDPDNDPDNTIPDTGDPGPPMAPGDIMLAEQVRNNLARAVEAHLRRLKTPNSPFARYVDGDYKELSGSAKRGLRLFIGKAACNECHRGPVLSDNQYHNIGVPSSSNPYVLNNIVASNAQAGLNSPLDQGRAGIVFIQFAECLVPNPMDATACLVPGPFAAYTAGGQWSDASETEKLAARAKFKALKDRDCMAGPPVCLPKPEIVGAFRTPMLINVAETGPYFHTGEVKTLEDVIWHYNRGGGSPGSYAGTKSTRLRPLGLSDAEVADLVSFLRSLTGEIPAYNCMSPDETSEGKWFVPPCPPPPPGS